MNNLKIELVLILEDQCLLAVCDKKEGEIHEAHFQKLTGIASKTMILSILD